MKIAICDDNKRDLELLKKLIIKCCNSNLWNADVLEFYDGESLLNNLKFNNFNIYFLDIYMKDLSGVEVAQIIRNKDEHALIIFTTSSEEFYRQGFDIGVMHYLVKPLDYTNLQDAMKRCIKQLGYIGRYIEIKVGKNTFKVRLANIYYIEVIDNACHIHIGGNEIVTYISLNEIEKLINEKSFLRCHRSFLVNIHAIAKKTSEGVLMKNGSMIPVPKNNRSNIYRQIDNFNIERMWE